MGKSKSLSLPEPPKFKADPTAATGIPDLLKYGQEAASGDFGGRLSWLSPTVNADNSRFALSAAQGLLEPQFRDTLTKIRNEAAANNQLESSTFTDALARSQSDLNSQYQSIVSQQAIRDAELSNQNRLSIFGTGLNTIQSAAGLGLTNQGQENQFNLSNYENQVAAAIANRKNPAALGGLATAIGAGAGFLVGGPVGAGIGATIGGGIGGTVDSYRGANSSAGFSGMSGGLGLLGSSAQTQQLGGLDSLLRSGNSAITPGQYASDFRLNSSNPYVSNKFFGNSLLN